MMRTMQTNATITKNQTFDHIGRLKASYGYFTEAKDVTLPEASVVFRERVRGPTRSEEESIGK